MRPLPHLLVFCCLLLPFRAAAQDPDLTGIVTEAGTTHYRVNTRAVECTVGTTKTQVERGTVRVFHSDCPARVLGESVVVFGRKKGGVLQATRVEVELPVEQAVEGFALIVRVVTAPHGGQATYRADGYLLAVGPKTKLTFAANSGLTLETVGTNVWVRYTGTLRTDGVVTAATVLFVPNVIGRREDTVRQKTDFDPLAVTEEERQGTLSRFVLGRKGSGIPAYKDAALQMRLDSIGSRLVPAYQKALPAGDPTSIDFRFQLVDLPRQHDGLTEPSGVIQVPFQLVEQLTDDSQLAAVLSADVAEVLEKQSVRAMPAGTALGAANIAGAAAGLVVPGLGIVTSLATGTSAAVIEQHQQEQSSRTGLALMEEAGFDIRQAPVAWWMLAAKSGKNLTQTAMPYRTRYLYGVLATAWRKQASLVDSAP